MSVDRDKLEDEEGQRFENIFLKSHRNLERGIFDPKSFYPEFKFKEPYGLQPLSDEPIYTIFPFYEQIIVHVGPFLKKDFKRLYGVSVKDLVELYKEDKIIPLLSKKYKDYPSHFDELFKAASRKDGHIPTSYRISSFLGTNGSTFSDVYETLKEKFKDSEFDNAITAIFKDEPNPKDTVINSIASCLSELKALGYDNLYSEIFEMENQNDAYWHSFWYSSFLTRPITVGLGGYSNYREDEFARLKMEELIAPQFLLYKFPKEIEIYIPSKVSKPVKYWNEIEKIEGRNDVINSLKNVSVLIGKGNIEKANGIITDISKPVIDVSKEATDVSLKSIKQYMNFGFSATSVTLLGLIESYEGIVISLAIKVIKELKKDDYAIMIDKLSKLLYNPKKINIVPMMLWMKTEDFGK